LTVGQAKRTEPEQTRAPLGVVRRLPDAAVARLAQHIQNVHRAQAGLEGCFTDLLIGMGVDLEKHDVQLSSDGRAAILTPKSTPTEEPSV
jgi:hypothetical protein